MDRAHLRQLRRVLDLALICLLAGAMLTALEGLLNSVYGALIAAASVLITIYCYRRANREAANSVAYYLWRYTPIALFALVPLVVYLWWTGEGWSAARLLTVLRLTTTFILPLACLLYADRGLRRALR